MPFHYHQRKEDAALFGRNPKEEGYYSPENVGMGARNLPRRTSIHR